MYCALLSKLACLDGVHDDDDKEDTAVANLARPNERIVARSSQTDKEAEMRAGGTRLARLQDMFRQVACMQPYWAMVSGKDM